MRYKPQVGDVVFLEVKHNSRGYKNNKGKISKVGKKYVYINEYNVGTGEYGSREYKFDIYDFGWFCGDSMNIFERFHENEEMYESYLYNVEMAKQIKELLNPQVLMFVNPDDMDRIYNILND